MRNRAFSESHLCNLDAMGMPLHAAKVKIQLMTTIFEKTLPILAKGLFFQRGVLDLLLGTYMSSV